jgi:hypothetical protein
MQENTKKHIKDLLKDLEIQLNTIDGELKDTIKTRRKLQKFYKKISKIY